VSGEIVRNRVRRQFYLDSVALMRLSQEIAGLPGVHEAALMIGTPANRRLMAEAGLLAEEGEHAEPNDLILAVRATSSAAAETALAAAEAGLDRRTAPESGARTWRPKSLAAAADALPGANLALISVPGAFAASEARQALRRGLHVMIFSDNVPIEEERRLKEEARERGLLLMGPDCGTAWLGGAPLAFANAVMRGAIGLVSASGTGLQEVACLLAQLGTGISHGIGVGGRDLGERVGGLGMLAAIDALDADPATREIMLISKPPAPSVAARLADRIAASRKRFTVCFLGLDRLDLPANARFAPTLHAAAEAASGRKLAGVAPFLSAKRKGTIRGLFSGGTLCAEAQLVLREAGLAIASNAPVPGAQRGAERSPGNVLLDLGADEYTLGRPHPMIEPTVRVPPLARALAEREVAVVLLDVVLGYGGHLDPAAAIVATIAAAPARRPLVVASVCGTDADPQNRSAQVAKLEAAGVLIAPSNATAAETAVALIAR
jgi:FdrA protein